jgi:Transposase DDE domain group 1
MNATPILPGLSAVEGKLLTATFDAGRLSSDGGVIVLREIAQRLRLAETITGPLMDDRDPTRVRHSFADMAMARMVMIAAGYEDCDDVDALRSDPALKIAIGRAPETGADLMSQPTLSRLENIADWRALARIGLGQIDLSAKTWWPKAWTSRFGLVLFPTQQRRCGEFSHGLGSSPRRELTSTMPAPLSHPRIWPSMRSFLGPQALAATGPFARAIPRLRSKSRAS